MKSALLFIIVLPLIILLLFPNSTVDYSISHSQEWHRPTKIVITAASSPSMLFELLENFSNN